MAEKTLPFEQFALAGEIIMAKPFGDGHINDTYIVTCAADGITAQYIVQRINHNIFKNPHEVMENISAVTGFMKEKIILRGGNPSRETLTIIPTLNGEKLFRDENGCFWRTYAFIQGTESFTVLKNPEQLYQSALKFGEFMSDLSDFPAGRLYETIKDFHDTPLRLEALKQAIMSDTANRARDCQSETQYLLACKALAEAIPSALKNGEIPLRVTHNDAKLNNVMFDKDTGKAVCVVDLDTVMPGTVLHDFGDSIRFGASTAAEDEQDLSLISISKELFEIYVKGFLKACGNALTPNEKSLLVTGAKAMILESAVRFLTDYLNGDIYFKTRYPAHNLVRAKNQIKLLSDITMKQTELQKIVDKYDNTP